MGRNNWVDWNGRIVPSGLFEPWDRDYKRKPDCVLCGDQGVLIECIDEERYDVTVPCWKCQVYCEVCNDHRKKSGHVCVPKGKEA